MPKQYSSIRNATIGELPRGSTRLMRCVSIASELAEFLIHIRGKPRFLDLLALSAKGFDISLRIRQEFLNGRTTPWSYFTNDSGRWAVIHPAFWPILKNKVQDTRRVTAPGADEAAAYEGKVEGIVIGWIQNGAAGRPDHLFAHADSLPRLREIVRVAFWTTVPSGNAVLSLEGLQPDTLSPSATYRTDLIDNFEERVRSFLDTGETRSYLLLGTQGSGKTTCILSVVRKLGLKTLRIPLKELYPQTSMSSPETVNNPLVSIILNAQPDILMVDDIDKAPKQVQNELLEFLDVYRSTFKIFVASANERRDIVPSLLRPERFDDHIVVDSLGVEKVTEILGESAAFEKEGELALKMRDWPIVYILDFKRRVRALGPDCMRHEIKELERRISEQAADNENHLLDLSRYLRPTG